MLRLEAERKRQGLSKAELARRAGLNVTTVNEACNAKRTPGSVQLHKLCKGLAWPKDKAHELLEDVGTDAGD